MYRSLTLVVFLSACSGSNIVVPGVDAGFDSQPDITKPEAASLCWSPGSYIETFTPQIGNTCRNIAPQTVEVSADGSIGNYHCSTIVNGCQITSTSCYSNTGEVYCSIYNQVEYTKNSGSGTMEIVCYPMICSPEGVCSQFTNSPDRCFGIYKVSLTK